MKTRMRRRLRVLGIGIGTAAAAAAVIGAAVRFVPPPRGLLGPYPAAVVIRDGDGGIIRIRTGPGDVVCLPVSIEEIGPWLAPAFVAGEDRRFFSHPGIDPAAVGRAAATNLRRMRIVSGASTITTLVVKLATERRGRGLGAKLSEGFRALQIERIMSKSDILEQYLNRAPFGGNLIGVGAASLRYFGRTPAHLSLPEAALLAALPRLPERLRPDRHPREARRARDKILDRMAALGMISPEESARAKKEPVPEKLRAYPFQAPHFCDLVLANIGAAREADSTLDPRLQALAETVTDSFFPEARRRGAESMAVVILHVPSGEIRALVGSPDWTEPRWGQVNCAAARRSPGSTLKPFIYCLAFERGICSPDTLLEDSPMDHGRYRPENYDRTFQGAVGAADALRRSLNLPAVGLLETIGPKTTAQKLSRAGISSLRGNADAGLSLAVGSCGASLLELAEACSVLARDGLHLPRRTIKGGEDALGERLFGSEAVFLVNDILSEGSRTRALLPATAPEHIPRFAWKTGTSNGHRDAWTLAWNPEYVVGVWAGDPAGGDNPDLAGIDIAPVAATIFVRLYPGGSGPWYRRPENCVAVSVCPVTGLLPGPDCPGRKLSLIIRGVSPLRRCRGEHYRPSAERTEPGPRISEPAEGDVLRLVEGIPGSADSVPLRATGGEGEKLYWFVDGTPLGTTAPEEPLRWRPVPGRHRISCSDSRGYADRVSVTVESPAG